MKKIIIALIFLGLSNILYAQEKGYVRIHDDSGISGLLQKHIDANAKKTDFSGYRIQIYSTSTYNTNVESLKERCKKIKDEFPQYNVYLNYFNPDFKIRAGNFRNRLESIPALYKIRTLYPESYPVKCNIKYSELIPQKSESNYEVSEDEQQ